MKKIFILILIIFSFLIVNANIICNDGSYSPTCSTCHRGCCSWHGGCASESYDSKSYENNKKDSETSNKNNSINLLIILGIGVGIGVFISSSIKRSN